MRRITLTQSASDDLDEIWDYIGVENHSPIAADNLIDEVGRQLRLVLEHPLASEAVDELRPKTRRIIIKQRYLVFFEPTDDGILVLRVLHGARIIRPEDLHG
jgi:toxin ParE1/3/4